MEGMLKIRLRPWVRRMFTRSVAIVPAAVVVGVYGAAGAGRLLVLSQAGALGLEQRLRQTSTTHYDPDRHLRHAWLRSGRLCKVVWYCFGRSVSLCGILLAAAH